MPRTGIYPGTFDPVTNGHMDVIARATRVVDQLIVGVAINAGKGPLFDLEERVAMVEHEISLLPDGAAERVKVQAFEGLLTDFAVSCDASIIVRGLRAVSDFEYEFQMTGMNRRLNPEIETVFLMASEKHQFISSRLVKEIVSMGGDIAYFVAPNVRDKLLEKYSDQ
ncbi:MAG: pantetheine-phosphate adenylyltransferase [Rhodospirillaceae bacterium]|jgi:pantetheine-phosphate adenylyltransferase|nr:pantetheine-phosphate adenylyltransferase [Rhodospirillaceae bacterium]MBT5940417.1 pantetheine-phosphate adenylyltransferase [Rhodospirillaceae bacterium]MBT7954115.1 pantetheine-phosphate adenylyltransferase [Rhodospirillaceae bacterium]